MMSRAQTNSPILYRLILQILFFAVAYKQMSEQCNPVFARYQFLGEDQIDTEGVTHAKDITWNHQHVILLGQLVEPAQIGHSKNVEIGTR